MRFLIAATALGLVPLDAFACGGFFCGPQQPVYQAGEEIVFGIDSEVCEVSAHISIVYDGAAEDFAVIDVATSKPHAALDGLAAVRRYDEYPVAARILVEGAVRDQQCVAVVTERQLELHRGKHYIVLCIKRQTKHTASALGGRTGRETKSSPMPEFHARLGE